MGILVENMVLTLLFRDKLDTYVSRHKQFGDKLCFWSVVLFLLFLMLESLAEICVKWVEFLPPMKLQNGYVDEKMSPSSTSG